VSGHVTLFKLFKLLNVYNVYCLIYYFSSTGSGSTKSDEDEGDEDEEEECTVDDDDDDDDDDDLQSVSSTEGSNHSLLSGKYNNILHYNNPGRIYIFCTLGQQYLYAPPPKKKKKFICFSIVWL